MVAIHAYFMRLRGLVMDLDELTKLFLESREVWDNLDKRLLAKAKRQAKKGTGNLVA